MSLDAKRSNVDDEIDFKQLFSTLWAGKLLIFAATCVFLFLGIIYLRGMAQTHSVSITYKPLNEQGAGVNIGGFGGIASFAGVGLPSTSNSDFDIFRHLITSEEVADEVFKNTELIKKLFSNEFDKLSGTFKMTSSGKVASIVQYIKSSISGQDILPYQPPNPARLVLMVKTSFSATVHNKSGFLTLLTQTSRPQVIVQLMEATIAAADGLLQTRYTQSASKSLKFLQKKLKQAKSREHREALAKLIVGEEKKLMLASTGQNFAVEQISRPEISLHPTSPKASFILTTSAVFGLFFGMALTLLFTSLNWRR